MNIPELRKAAWVFVQSLLWVLLVIAVIIVGFAMVLTFWSAVAY